LIVLALLACAHANLALLTPVGPKAKPLRVFVHHVFPQTINAASSPCAASNASLPISHLWSRGSKWNCRENLCIVDWHRGWGWLCPWRWYGCLVSLCS